MVARNGGERPEPAGTPRHERLSPGERCAISEAEWFAVLESTEPLHQWGSALLVDEGGSGCVRVYVRDVSGAARHTALRLDAEGSRRAREGVQRVEDLARRAATLVTEIQARGGSSLDEMRRQEQASDAFVQAAEALYRELLGG